MRVLSKCLPRRTRAPDGRQVLSRDGCTTHPRSAAGRDACQRTTLPLAQHTSHLARHAHPAAPRRTLPYRPDQPSITHHQSRSRVASCVVVAATFQLSSRQAGRRRCCFARHSNSTRRNTPKHDEMRQSGHEQETRRPTAKRRTNEVEEQGLGLGQGGTGRHSTAQHDATWN